MTLSAPSCRLFILILTEDAGAAQPLAVGLRAHGHEVFVTRSEDQAGRTLVVHASDVIVIDTWLGGEDGYDIADRLCDPMRKRPLVIGVTGPFAGAGRPRPRPFDHEVPRPVDAEALTLFLSAHHDSLVQDSVVGSNRAGRL